MQNESMEKDLFEAALRNAVRQCVEEECDSIWEEYADSPEPNYSWGFRLRMWRLLQKNKGSIGGWQTYSKRVATVAVVLGVGFFSAMSVEALRVPISNFFLSITEKGTEINLEGTNSNQLEIPEEWEFVYSPAYLPQGYLLQTTDFYGNGLGATYSAGEHQEIYFSQNQSFNGMVSLDTEDTGTEQIFIGTAKGVYVDKNGRSTLFWSNSDGWYLLSATLGREDTLKIAKSVEKIEK